SMPTTSAPAARASSALAPAGQNTATRTVLPVPAGSTVEPRTCWSDFLASTPRRTATSTDSTNFTLALSRTSLSASSIAYALPGVIGDWAFSRLVIVVIGSALHRQAHGTGRARDRLHRRVQVGRGQVGFLRLGDVLEMLAGDLAHLFGVGALGAGLDARRLHQRHRRGRPLGDEGEGAVRVRGDDHRGRQAGLELLRGGVERLAELHDVQAALAEGGAHGRRRIGLSGLDLQLDVTDYFLCHFFLLLRVQAPCGSSRCDGQAFSTWPNSSSTGVDRPKISTATRRRLFS